MNASLHFRASLLAAASLLPIISSPAMAKPNAEPRPTASASINISVSVAPRFHVATIERASGVEGYCIASNGDDPLLPVTLRWPSPARAIPLFPCGTSANTPLASGALAGADGVQTLIVRPE